MPQLLIELFSEEIPARMQARAAEELKAALVGALTAAGLAPKQSEAHVGPRRVALVLEEVPAQQPDLTEEKRGPRVDGPEQAVQGFLKTTGLTLAQLEQRDTGKGVFYFAVTQTKGRPALDVLPGLLADVILGYTWPKSMRWRNGRLAWVRPLRNILALFGGQVLPGGLHIGVNEEGGRAAGYVAACDPADANCLPYTNATFGHRFLAPQRLTVTDFADYRAKLAAAKVVLSAADRKAAIHAEASELARAAGFALLEDAGLLDEVAGLVEYPVPLMGRIDAAFMDVPGEVLSTSMRTHQKYFSVVKPEGGLAPHFITVANMAAADGGKAIVNGNERVLRARLSDAKFFWDQDRKIRLEDWGAKLVDRVFHAKLGTMAERVARLVSLAERLAPAVKADPAQAARAALLAKADLSTGMVGEFPELQGVMGRYYALHQGEAAPVADAIADHYSPLGPSDRCPDKPVSIAVALADKIDLLAGFFAIDEKPTGSKDPFAQRRAALGILRLIMENGLRLALRAEFAAAVAAYTTRPNPNQDKATVDAILAFLRDRLKVYLRETGVRHDVVQAVLAGSDDDDVIRVLARVRALSGFVGSDVGANLLAGYRRACNILRIEEKKDGRSHDGAVDAALLRETAEQVLFRALTTVTPAVQDALSKDDFEAAMTVLGDLRAPVDAFFDAVTVNADDAALRANRLALLGRIRAGFAAIADFQAIEG